MSGGPVPALGLAQPATTSLATALAVGLVAVTVAGVAQARQMTRLRQAVLRDPGSLELTTRVQRGAQNAAALRIAIAVLSMALLVLGVVAAG